MSGTSAHHRVPKPLGLDDTVAQVSRSVVHVSQTFHMRANEAPGEVVSGTITGTGFIGDKNGHIVTAAHVVSAKIARISAEAALTKQGKTPNPGSFTSEIEISVYQQSVDERPKGSEIYNVHEFFSAHIYAIDSARDIALFGVRPNLVKNPATGIKIGNSGNISLSVPAFQVSPPRPGIAVTTTGFPGVFGEDTGLPGPTTNTGIISNPLYINSQRRHFYLADLHVNHGDSGAPVFNDSDGRIIGLTDAYFNTLEGENSHLAMIIPAKDFLALLTSSKV